MTKEIITDRIASLSALSHASRMAATSPEEPSDSQSSDLEREYLSTCQKLEQLVERKQRAYGEMDDVSDLHQELSLIGSRIQREPEDRSHEDDYLAVLRRVRESLGRRIEAEDLKGEFQKSHFELLGLGHKLGFDRSAPPAEPKNDFKRPGAFPMTSAEFDQGATDEMNLSDVERQIAELQAQIRSLHSH
ncbi:MAG TPA: hypothetical protein VGL53_18065 [Bryobacteraceae bacterium]|jgi:hypothetical protein